MTDSTHMTPSKFTTEISSVQLEELSNMDYTITTDEQFTDIVVPLLETIIPDYLRDGVLPYPMAVYYGKNIGEYLFAQLDTWDRWKIYPSDWHDHSLALMAVYFGYENGEHYFYLGDGASILETRDLHVCQHLQDLHTKHASINSQ